MQADACYTHRRTQVTKSHKTTRGTVRVIKRDEGHDPGVDKGEGRNSNMEVMLPSPCQGSTKSPAGTEGQRGHNFEAVLEFWKGEPIPPV